MTDTEKLKRLVNYIRHAERYHLNMAERGIASSRHKCMAIQDIQEFMEHELGIEYIQLENDK